MIIITVLGTRPEIIKMAPLLPELDALGEHIIVHSGQHYSAEMDSIFFNELELREPDEFLKVGSTTPVLQVAKIAAGVEKIILKTNPDLVVVHGDTNTTLGGALAAAKYRHKGVRLAHVEAGARSFNELQPEELNRQLVDRMSDLLFAPTQYDAENLRREGFDMRKVIVTGNTVIESCKRMAGLIDFQSSKTGNLKPYVLVTMHRAENVDNEGRLLEIWNAFCVISNSIQLIFPIHPRTKKMLDKAGIHEFPSNMHITDPVGYKGMIELLKNAKFCLTDSGGLQEEAAILGVPALVLRDTTEHQRYIDCGIHVITGHDKKKIISEATQLLNEDELYRRRKNTPALDCNVTERIINILRNI